MKKDKGERGQERFVIPRELKMIIISAVATVAILAGFDILREVDPVGVGSDDPDMELLDCSESIDLGQKIQSRELKVGDDFTISQDATITARAGGNMQLRFVGIGSRVVAGDNIVEANTPIIASSLANAGVSTTNEGPHHLTLQIGGHGSYDITSSASERLPGVTSVQVVASCG